MPDKTNTNSEEPQSFVVRTWREGPGRWRGKISHVQSKDSRAFTRLEESTSFMAERLPGVKGEEAEVGGQRSDVRKHSFSPSNLQPPVSNLSRSWLPKKRSLRLGMAAVSVCVVAAIAVLVYPSNDSPGSMLGTAQGSGLDTALIFFLGAVAGGSAMGIWARSKRKI